MLHIVKIEPNSNGSHDDQMGVGIGIPSGWAIIPEGFCIPETYPFVDIEAEEIIETTTGENGEQIQKPTGVYRVTSMTAGVKPERKEIEEKPMEREPSKLDIIEAQVTYTAMMTDSLLEV